MESILEEIEKYYLISETGVIYRIKTFSNKPTFKECKPIKLNNMYYVTITLDGKQKKYKIDTLVANKYLPNPKYHTKIKHRDNDISNNNVTNLIWYD